MKTKKRILSLILAILLFTALAVPAAAASFPFSGTYDGCNYNTSNNCYSFSYNSLIELTSCPNGNWEDYLLQAKIIAYDVDGSVIQNVAGARQPYISSVSGANSNVYRIECFHYINNRQVIGPLSVRNT